MADSYCPRCRAWRSHAELVDVLYHGRGGVWLKPEFLVERMECAACGIYWFSDKPAQQWWLGDGRPAR